MPRGAQSQTIIPSGRFAYPHLRNMMPCGHIHQDNTPQDRIEATKIRKKSVHGTDPHVAPQAGQIGALPGSLAATLTQLIRPGARSAALENGVQGQPYALCREFPDNHSQDWPLSQRNLCELIRASHAFHGIDDLLESIDSS